MNDELNLNDSSQVELDSKRFKFMTNILKGPSQQTRYMKSLEKITMDAQVSFHRLFISTFIIAVAFMLYVSKAALAGPKTLYVIVWATFVLIGVFILLVNFLLSARNRSMLSTSIILLMTPILESIRRKAKRTGDLKSIGIKNFKDGVITFTNGDVGVIYKIDGQLSLSTLPSVADAVADERARYLISRTATSQEQMLVSVKEVDTRSQIRNLKRYFDHQSGDNLRDAWTQYMADLTGEYIHKYINYEFTIAEHVIVRDIDIESLKKSVQKFEDAARAGVYAKIERITSRKELVYAVGSLAMLSKGGLIKHAKD